MFFKASMFEQVAQRAGEERAHAPEGDDGEVEGDPEAEPAEVVVKAGLAEAVGQDAEGGISAPTGRPRPREQDAAGISAANNAGTLQGKRESVDGLVAVFHFH